MKGFLDKLAGLSIAYVLVLGGLAGGIYYLWIFDDGAAIDTQTAGIQSEISIQEVKKKETETVLKEESRMRELVVQQTDKFAEIAKRLPSQLSTLQVNESIDGFVKLSGVTIKSKRPGSAEKHEIVEEIPIQVTLEGSYSELASFIYQLSTNERVTSLKTFTLNQIGDLGRATLDGNVVGYRLATEQKPKTEGTQ